MIDELAKQLKKARVKSLTVDRKRQFCVMKLIFSLKLLKRQINLNSGQQLFKCNGYPQVSNNGSGLATKKQQQY